MATSKAIIPHEYRYSVEVRHRAFFEDPRSEQQLERALGDVGAEWVTFEPGCPRSSRSRSRSPPDRRLSSEPGPDTASASAPDIAGQGIANPLGLGTPCAMPPETTPLAGFHRPQGYSFRCRRGGRAKACGTVVPRRLGRRQELVRMTSCWVARVIAT